MIQDLVQPIPHPSTASSIRIVFLRNHRCVMCGLIYSECPGHYGHIELALPLFNPLLFRKTYLLLKVITNSSFNIKCSSVKVLGVPQILDEKCRCKFFRISCFSLME
jgi:DNA-directed RNA polymerase beta' subunit